LCGCCKPKATTAYGKASKLQQVKNKASMVGRCNVWHKQ